VQARPVVNINSTDNFDYSKFFKTEDDYLKYKQMVSGIYSTETSTEILQNEFVLVALFAVIVMALAAAYAALTVKTKVATSGVIDETMENIEPIFKLWTKESIRKLDYDIVRSELIVKTADEYVSALSAEIQGVKQEALKEFLVVNLAKYYGL